MGVIENKNRSFLRVRFLDDTVEIAGQVDLNQVTREVQSWGYSAMPYGGMLRAGTRCCHF